MLLEVPIKKDIVHGFTIFQQNNAQILPYRINETPFANTPIVLYSRFHGVRHNGLDPGEFNPRAIRTLSGNEKIAGKLQFQVFSSSGEWTIYNLTQQSRNQKGCPKCVWLGSSEASPQKLHPNPLGAHFARPQPPLFKISALPQIEWVMLA
uniref:Uncharacterized protein n=1 Tax=Candidatus Kentrum sp. UNK TaxID=2126344 RepID=A0A451AI95_9GAMM|nr:MAG: hypothetical protein BECKUNK1418G_GA0071005_106823 [Candidatus Kentron sp. UNK]VFK72929.1 MAG: hypothetical protein BECKUNK1418H_GA0071006_11502 [Candidatus Kentron sp. UNK]